MIDGVPYFGAILTYQTHALDDNSVLSFCRAVGEFAVTILKKVLVFARERAAIVVDVRRRFMSSRAILRKV